VSILPAYFFSSVKHSVANKKMESQQREPVVVPDPKTLKVVEELNKKLNLIKLNSKDKFNVSEQVINAVILKKTNDIKITDIVYSNDVNLGKKISVEGYAPSRNTLLAFRLALEDDPLFKKVDLPISNFVKGKNITFYLNLILAQ
jgi:Tfp pilus assembly protein PilN